MNIKVVSGGLNRMNRIDFGGKCYANKVGKEWVVAFYGEKPFAVVSSKRQAEAIVKAKG